MELLAKVKLIPSQRDARLKCETENTNGFTARVSTEKFPAARKFLREQRPPVHPEVVGACSGRRPA